MHRVAALEWIAAKRGTLPSCAATPEDRAEAAKKRRRQQSASEHDRDADANNEEGHAYEEVLHQ